MKDLKEQLIIIGRELELERDRAFELWSYLPSHHDALQHHGDYAVEYKPSTIDIMTEARMYIHDLKNTLRKTGDGSILTVEQIKEAGSWYKCPCDEHDGEF